MVRRRFADFGSADIRSLGENMNFRSSAGLALAIAFLSIINAGTAHAGAPPATAGLPDACKLMTQADVEALFPRMPVKSFQRQLSPVYQGPQYVAICGYSVKLPTARLPKYASLVISQCRACGKHMGPASLAGAPAGEARVQGNQVKLLQHVGDEAFEVFNSGLDEYKLYVRKDDLIFILTLDRSSARSESNAVALARQAVKRWRGGVGMVAAATPIDTKSVVEATPYTPPPSRVNAQTLASLAAQSPAVSRPRTSVPQDKWPDPCKLLTLADVHAVFGDMTISHDKEVQIPMPDNIPAPRSCSYSAHKTVTVQGKRDLIFNSIRLTIFDMALSVDLANRYYRMSHGNQPLPGLGDEASIDDTNHIYIRKGVLNVTLYVGGDVRDRARFEDSRKRLSAIARRVAAHLP